MGLRERGAATWTHSDRHAGEGESEAACPYALDGLEYVAGPILGGDTLQALCMALRFVGLRLHEFMAGGGRVLDDDGEDFGIEAVFGPLLTDKLVTTAQSNDDD